MLVDFRGLARVDFPGTPLNEGELQSPHVCSVAGLIAFAWSGTRDGAIEEHRKVCSLGGGCSQNQASGRSRAWFEGYGYVTLPCHQSGNRERVCGEEIDDGVFSSSRRICLPLSCRGD